jgi:hypothetical protein
LSSRVRSPTCPCAASGREPQRGRDSRGCLFTDALTVDVVRCWPSGTSDSGARPQGAAMPIVPPLLPMRYVAAWHQSWPVAAITPCTTLHHPGPHPALLPRSQLKCQGGEWFCTLMVGWVIAQLVGCGWLFGHGLLHVQQGLPCMGWSRAITRPVPLLINSERVQRLPTLKGALGPLAHRGHTDSTAGRPLSTCCDACVLYSSTHRLAVHAGMRPWRSMRARVGYFACSAHTWGGACTVELLLGFVCQRLSR